MSILLDEMGLDEMSINQSDGCCSTLAQNLQPCTEGTWDKHHQHTTIKQAQSSCQNTLVFSRAATSVVYQKLPSSSSEKKSHQPAICACANISAPLNLFARVCKLGTASQEAFLAKKSSESKVRGETFVKNPLRML